MRERFPVLWGSTADRERLGCPHSIPWSLVAPHEKQAMSNHGGQTLQRLADRGGLDPAELVAVLRDRSFAFMPIADAVNDLNALVDQAGSDASGSVSGSAGGSSGG